MKKLLTSLLAILMVLSLLAACRREEEKAEEKKEPVTEEQGKPVEEKEEEKIPKDFTLGKVDGQTYENAFIKIGCRLPEDGHYLSEEERNTRNGIDEALTGDGLVKAYLEMEKFLDLEASVSQGSSCSLSMEKMDNEQLEALDLTKYYAAQVAEIKTSYGDRINEEGNAVELGTVMLDGKSFDCIYLKSTANDTTLVRYTIAIKCDGYLATLVLTICGEENQKEFLDCFYLLK